MSRNNADGSWKQAVSGFRDEIAPDTKFPPVKGRYHLYVAYLCPFAQRALIVRALKGLEEYIDISVVHPHLLEGGWHFVPKELENEPPKPISEHDDKTFPGSTVDKLYGSSHLAELYKRADPSFAGRISVPVLWDTESKTIVNNESAEILRNLNTAFNSMLPEELASVDLYPAELRTEIDALSEWITRDICIGVYRAGFATSQAAYDAAIPSHTEAMRRVDKHLEGKTYLVGERLTEIDIMLYTTIVRYDGVYYVLFKCNWGSVRTDYPNLNRWLKNLYWNHKAFRDTTNFDHIKEGYYFTKGIIPYGPNVWVEPLDKPERR